jgi:hypothetical protein
MGKRIPLRAIKFAGGLLVTISSIQMIPARCVLPAPLRFHFLCHPAVSGAAGAKHDLKIAVHEWDRAYEMLNPFCRVIRRQKADTVCLDRCVSFERSMLNRPSDIGFRSIPLWIT